MPDLNGKKVSDIHKSIMNIGGLNNGVTDDPLPICDGSGVSTGIYISNYKANIDARRGILKGYMQKGGVLMKGKVDNSFPNTSSALPVSSEQSKIILDLDKYSHFRINFNRDDFTPKFYIKSYYFDQSFDGEDEIVGYWQRTFAGIEKYFVDQDDYVDPILEIDESVYFLDPSPLTIEPGTDIFYNFGFIKKRFISYKGIQHNPGILEFYLILSADDGVSVDIPIISVESSDAFTRESWLQYRPTDGTGNPYSSVSVSLEYVPNGLNVKSVNFGKMIVTNNIAVYKVVITNPSLYKLNNYKDFGEATPCGYFGEEVLPNVDIRFYETFQSGISGDSDPVNVLVYKIS